MTRSLPKVCQENFLVFYEIQSVIYCVEEHFHWNHTNKKVLFKLGLELWYKIIMKCTFF